MRIAILGGGISGLSMAWWLHRHAEVRVFEKTSSVGGYLQTDLIDGFLFDRGPRTFRIAGGHPFRTLVSEIGLEKEMIVSAPAARTRYLLEKGQLRPISPVRFLPHMLKEWRIPVCDQEETIADFAMRRFNRELAETVFDALTLGVHGGSMYDLSMDAAFPKIKEWERRYGSLTKALIVHRGQLRKTSLVSFLGGSGALTQCLASRLGERVSVNAAVIRVEWTEMGAKVITETGSFEADYVVSALPVTALSTYFPALNHLAKEFSTQSLQIVQCGFHQNVLSLPGFGYLVPTREQEQILGTVFDSQLFPQHNRALDETRLTLMVRTGCDGHQIALDALKRHLKITLLPAVFRVLQADQAIPQFTMGHQKRVAELRAQVSFSYPRLYLIGNYLSGVSVADCIATSKQVSEALLQTCSNSIR